MDTVIYIFFTVMFAICVLSVIVMAVWWFWNDYQEKTKAKEREMERKIRSKNTSFNRNE